MTEEQTESYAERLKKSRKRKVPNRGDAVLDTNQETFSIEDEHNSHSVKEVQAVSPENDEEIETARSSIKLEKQLHDDLRDFLTRKRLSRDAWIEGTYLFLKDHPEIMEQVSVIAYERHNMRKQRGNKRRAQALQKYNSSS